MDGWGVGGSSCEMAALIWMAVGYWEEKTLQSYLSQLDYTENVIVGLFVYFMFLFVYLFDMFYLLMHNVPGCTQGLYTDFRLSEDLYLGMSNALTQKQLPFCRYSFISVVVWVYLSFHNFKTNTYKINLNTVHGLISNFVLWFLQSSNSISEGIDIVKIPKSLQKMCLN